LTTLLDDTLQGDFFERYEVADAQRIIRDIAISGNGEPTLSPDFAAVVDLIGEVARERKLPATAGRTLITNGSGLGKASVQTGLAAWSEQGGDIWFKLDRATAEGIWRINQVHLDPEAHLHRLKLACQYCPTRLQTCLFGIKGQNQDEAMEIQAYLDLLTDIKQRAIPLQGITLYGLARPSMQPESELLIPWPQARFDELAERIRQLGFEVRVSV
jgi:wyosine [tRNA(Phe)-imidazoG37] synthetase (radical SAM superfamily)